MRRANGTGSVYKLKQKLRKPYKAVVTLGWTDDGKRIRKCLGYFEKSKEAWSALSEYYVNPDKFDNQDVTFAQAWDWMIEEKRRNGVDIAKGKFNASKVKLTPIWNMPMQQIRLAHLQAIIDSYKHLGRSSHENLHKAMNGVFKEAIKNDVITKNYASMVTLPPVEKSTIHKPFSEEELTILWKNTHLKLVKILLIYIYTGARPIELTKIELAKVNIKDRYMVGGVKTKSGKNRIIPIAKCILPFINELYALASFKRSDTLIPKGYMQMRLDNPLRRLCKELNISEHKPHDTRHTFITLARKYNMDLYILKTIVGHTHNDVTSDVYTHKTIKDLIDAVDALPTKFVIADVATM